MALSFALLVCGAPYGSESASQAYLFARELLAQGHLLKKVFFYQEGVMNANMLTSPASDEVGGPPAQGRPRSGGWLAYLGS